MHSRVWKSNPSSHNTKVINCLRKHYKITDITAKILIDRGIDTTEKVHKFWNVDESNLRDPFLLEDMRKAVGRVLAAKNEHIMVFGDYDVDGLTANAMLTKALRQKRIGEVTSIAGTRMCGYGIKPEHIIEAYKKRITLILAVDVGTTCFHAQKKAEELGIDLIILDHHLLKEKAVRAYAFINPQRGNYPFKGLCAAGVVFKFLQALNKVDGGLVLSQYLEFVALATIADVVPLIDENRYFAKEGLKQLSNPFHEGVRAFLTANSFCGRKITSDVVAYILGPRINAAGRLREPSKVLEMLLVDKSEYKKAIRIAKDLTNLNNERKKIEHKIRDEVLEMIKKDNLLDDRVLVMASDNWHKGVVGIVASVISDMFHRPCGLIGIEGDRGYGSFRNIPEFDLMFALNKCQDTLIKFGGHKMAAGFSVETKKVQVFREKINKVARLILRKKDLIPTSYYDAIVNFKSLNDRLNSELEKLEPFGEGNRFPIFLIEDVLIPRAQLTKDGEHLRLTIMKDKTMISGIMFWGASYNNLINDAAQKYDMLVEFDKNIYDGKEFLQVSLRDLKTVGIKW